MTESTAIKPLQASAKQARKYVFDQIYASGSGHPGGSLSCIDVLVALYLGRIKPDKAWISCIDRDHVILSKGHAVPALYSVLALCDLIPEEELKTLRHLAAACRVIPTEAAWPKWKCRPAPWGKGSPWALARRKSFKPLAGSFFLRHFGRRRVELWSGLGSHCVCRQPPVPSGRCDYRCQRHPE